MPKYTDAPLGAAELKAAGYTDAPLATPTPPPSLRELSQSRPHGGFTTGEDEGVVSRTIRGMVHPTPGQQLAIDLAPPVAGAMEALPDILATKNPIISRPNVAKVAEATKAVVSHPVTQSAIGATVGYAHGGIPGAVEGAVFGPVIGRGPQMMRVFAKLSEALQKGTKEAPATTTAKAKPATLNDSLTSILEHLRAESGTSEGPPTLKTTGAPRLVKRVPLNQAVEDVRKAAPAAHVKPTAEEFEAATAKVQEGEPADEVMEALLVVRALKASASFKNLPDDAAMEADMAQRAVSGQKSLMPRFGPKAPGGNPFR